MSPLKSILSRYIYNPNCCWTNLDEHNFEHEMSVYKSDITVDFIYQCFTSKKEFNIFIEYFGGSINYDDFNTNNCEALSSHVIKHDSLSTRTNSFSHSSSNLFTSSTSSNDNSLRVYDYSSAKVEGNHCCMENANISNNLSKSTCVVSDPEFSELINAPKQNKKILPQNSPYFIQACIKENKNLQTKVITPYNPNILGDSNLLSKRHKCRKSAKPLREKKKQFVQPTDKIPYQHWNSPTYQQPHTNYVIPGSPNIFLPNPYLPYQMYNNSILFPQNSMVYQSPDVVHSPPYYGIGYDIYGENDIYDKPKRRSQKRIKLENRINELNQQIMYLKDKIDLEKKWLWRERTLAKSYTQDEKVLNQIYSNKYTTNESNSSQHLLTLEINNQIHETSQNKHPHYCKKHKHLKNLENNYQTSSIINTRRLEINSLNSKRSAQIKLVAQALNYKRHIADVETQCNNELEQVNELINSLKRINDNVVKFDDKSMKENEEEKFENCIINLRPQPYNEVERESFHRSFSFGKSVTRNFSDSMKYFHKQQSEDEDKLVERSEKEQSKLNDTNHKSASVSISSLLSEKYFSSGDSFQTYSIPEDIQINSNDEDVTDGEDGIEYDYEFIERCDRKPSCPDNDQDDEINTEYDFSFSSS